MRNTFKILLSIIYNGTLEVGKDILYILYEKSTYFFILSYLAQFLAVTSKVSCRAWLKLFSAFIRALAMVLINKSTNSSKASGTSISIDVTDFAAMFILLVNIPFVAAAILERIARFSSSMYKHHTFAILLSLNDFI